jgi:hypothetical protein
MVCSVYLVLYSSALLLFAAKDLGDGATCTVKGNILIVSKFGCDVG